MGMITVATVLFLPGREYFAKGQWALLYLLLIVLIAGLCGVQAALLASGLAFLAWNFFFLPPYYRFTIHDPKDWLSLVVFLFVGVLIGLQTGRMHEREAEAHARERDTALLNRLSAHLVSVTSTHAMADVLLTELRDNVHASSVTLWLPDGQGTLASVASVPAAMSPDMAIQHCANLVFRENKAIGLPTITHVAELGVENWPIILTASAVPESCSPGALFLPLQTMTQIEGVLHLGPRQDHTLYSPPEARLVVSVANLAATFLERQRLESSACRADALREADRLKNTLLSSVSHELRTPLAAMKTTVTGLLADDVRWDESFVRHELKEVDHDLTRLNAIISPLLDLSRLEADAWTLRKDWYEVNELLGVALGSLSAAEHARLTYAVPDDMPALYVDGQQCARAVQHLVENALAYAPGSPIRIGAGVLLRECRLWVEDAGPGIPPEERAHIFAKFYRGAQALRTVPSGTGLGLAIAQEVTRYHGGRLWVEDVQPQGARFVMAFPCPGERADAT